jgi:hypothetical protein
VRYKDSVNVQKRSGEWFDALALEVLEKDFDDVETDLDTE